MKTPMKKYFVITLTMLALIASAAGVTPAYAASSFTSNPSSWNAGTVDVGSSVDLTFNVTNTGDSLNGSNLTKLISGSSDFKIIYSQCPWSWTNGTSCQVQVRFQPTGSGPRSATLSVFIAGVYSLDIPLSGSGAGGSTGPLVSVNPTSWNFGNQAVGSASAVKTFTVTNSGDQSLSIGTLAVSGNFAVSGNTCNGATVPAAGTCTFGVTFSPGSAGAKTGSVSIPSNAASSPEVVSLSGSGVLQVKERVKNGGLNTYSGTSKIPANWVKNVTFSSTDGKDTKTKKEGLASVKVIGASGKTKTLKQTLNLSGVSGDKFTFTFWARGSAIPSAGVCKGQVLLYDGSTLKLTKTVNCKTGTYSAFQKKTLSFNATSKYTKVVILFTYKKAGGTIWFDLVSLKK
jgi:hypothetical protein